MKKSIRRLLFFIFACMYFLGILTYTWISVDNGREYDTAEIISSTYRNVGNDDFYLVEVDLVHNNRYIEGWFKVPSTVGMDFPEAGEEIDVVIISRRDFLGREKYQLDEADADAIARFAGSGLFALTMMILAMLMFILIAILVARIRNSDKTEDE